LCDYGDRVSPIRPPPRWR